MTRDEDGLDFERADFDSPEPGAPPAATPGVIGCSHCGRVITDAYYTRAAELACSECEARLRAAGPPGSAVTRGLGALGLGLVAAAVASALWMAVTRLTGYEIGLIAIAVGWIVGLAVMVGGRSVGGWPYQLLAVVLTYTAIVATYVPHLVPELEAQYREAVAAEQADRADAPEQADPLAGLAEQDAGPEAREAEIRTVAWTMAIVFAFAIPFLGGLENAIGLLIIGFGLYQAFVMTRRRDLRWAGPFAVGGAGGAAAESAAESGARADGA